MRAEKADGGNPSFFQLAIELAEPEDAFDSFDELEKHDMCNLKLQFDTGKKIKS